MRPIFLACACLLAACGSDPFGPQGLGPVEYADFLKADTDNSGKLSPEEAKAFADVSRNFQRYDADGDGLIAWNELKRVGRMDSDRQRAPAEPRQLSRALPATVAG